MGRRGPPPKPTVLKELQGTRRADREARREPVAEAARPGQCPAYLGAQAKAAWKRIEPFLLQNGLLTIADATVLELLCSAYEEWREADKLVKKGGLVLAIPTGKGNRTIPKANPAVAIRSDAWRRVIVAGREFGLTPGSRARVESDPFNALGVPVPGSPAAAAGPAASPAAPPRDPNDPLAEFAG